MCGEDLVSCVTNKYVPEKKAKKSGAYPNCITSSSILLLQPLEILRSVSMRSMRMLIIRNLSVIVCKNTNLYVKICISTHFQFSEIYFFLKKKRSVSESYNQLLEINAERSNANYTGTHYTIIIRFFFQCVLYTHAWVAQPEIYFWVGCK